MLRSYQTRYEDALLRQNIGWPCLTRLGKNSAF